MSFEGSRDPTPEPTTDRDGATTPWDEDMLSPDDVVFPSEDVDDVVVDGFKGEKIIGLCDDMCPQDPSELSRNRSILFESTDRDKTDYDLNKIVKAYARADAGKEVRPTLIRTPHCLYQSIRYLLTHILEKHGTWREWDDGNSREIRLIDIYSFMRDRFRSIRNDYSIQSHISLWSVRCLEYTVRFHIMAGHLLCNRHPGSGFDAKGNRDMLDDALIDRLWGYYDAFREKYRDPKTGQPTPGVDALRNIGEFAAYRLLYKELAQHDDHKKWRESTEHDKPWLPRGGNKRSSGGELKALSSMPEVLSHPLVKNAMRIIGLYTSDSWVRFFDAVKTAPYLQACLMGNVFPFVRITTLSRMWLNEKFGRNPKFPMSLLVKRLQFDNSADAKKFVETVGYEVDSAGEYITSTQDVAPDCEYCEPQHLRFPSQAIEDRRHHRSHLAVCIGEDSWAPSAMPTSTFIPLKEEEYEISESSESIAEQEATPIRIEPATPVVEAVTTEQPESMIPNNIEIEVTSSLSESDGEQQRQEEMDIVLAGIPPPPGEVPGIATTDIQSAVKVVDTTSREDIENTGRSAFELTIDRNDVVDAHDIVDELRPVPPPRLESPPRLSAESTKKICSTESTIRFEVSNFERKGRNDILTAHVSGLARIDELKVFHSEPSNITKAIKPSKKKLLNRLRECAASYDMSDTVNSYTSVGCFTTSVVTMTSLSSNLVPTLATVASKYRNGIRICIPYVEVAYNISSMYAVGQSVLWQVFGNDSLYEHYSQRFHNERFQYFKYQSWCDVPDTPFDSSGVQNISDIVIIPVLESCIDKGIHTVISGIKKSLRASSRIGAEPLSGVIIFFFNSDVPSVELTRRLQSTLNAEYLGTIAIKAINAQYTNEVEILQSWDAVVSHLPGCSYLPVRTLFCDAAAAISSIPESYGEGIMTQHYVKPDSSSGIWSVLLHFKQLLDVVAESLIQAIEELNLCDVPEDTDTIKNELKTMWSSGEVIDCYTTSMIQSGGQQGGSSIIKQLTVRNEVFDQKHSAAVYSEDGLRSAAEYLFGVVASDALLSSVKSAACSGSRSNPSTIATNALYSLLTTQETASCVGIPQCYLGHLRTAIKENIYKNFSPPLPSNVSLHVFESDFSELMLILNPDLSDEKSDELGIEHDTVMTESEEQQLEKAKPIPPIVQLEPRTKAATFSTTFLSELKALRESISKQKIDQNDEEIEDNSCSDAVSGYIALIRGDECVGNISKNLSLERLTEDILDSMKRRKLDIMSAER